MSEPAPERLTPEEQTRGRRVAIASHPFSMTFRTATTGDMATQALVTLGAAEAVVGLHAGLLALANVFQLPALRLVNRVGKRGLLLGTQVVALVAILPMLAFGALGAQSWAVPVALLSLGLTGSALLVGSTAWWPLLHGFVAPGGTGRFFAALRTSWHLALIAFFVFCPWWLRHNPGSFGVLFGVAAAGGLVRVALIPLFPERAEPSPLRAREALRLLWRDVALRRYQIGVSLETIVYRSLPPFTVVMLRRAVGLSDAETFAITLAFFTGGLLALVPAGRLADRVGSGPVLVASCALRAVLVAAMGLAILLPNPRTVLWVVTGGFFLYSLLTAAFGVAEVKLLFRLAPEEAPTGVIVLSGVVRNVVAALVPITAGAVIQFLLSRGADALSLYRGFFLFLAVIQATAIVWLRKAG